MAKEKPGQKRYPSELKGRATKMVLDLRAQDPNDVNVISRVARQLGVGSESLRTWVMQSEV
jgi:transposase